MAFLQTRLAVRVAAIFVAMVAVLGIIYGHELSLSVFKEFNFKIASKSNHSDSEMKSTEEVLDHGLPHWMQSFYAKKMKDWNNNLLLSELFAYLMPEVYCPYIARLGSIHDGGKRVCNVVRLPKKNCSIYSLGIHNEISFEEDLHTFNRNNCRIFGYDKDLQSKDVIKKYKAMGGKIKVAEIDVETNKDLGHFKLADLVKQNGDKSVEFLKIDIEGAENTVLVPFLKEIQTCQVFLEIHGDIETHRALLKQLSILGYRLFDHEFNPATPPCCCEYSFIHTSCMERYDVSPLATYLNTF
ncbi:hypothetical protein Q1695_008162 [Nippostrongylus brasiliensis]|nr:hypothetical protein Q1695_008162 [Nippostrongylus brasiliensis]